MSWQLRVLNAVLRTVGRPLLQRTKSPERARRDFELASRLFFRGPKRDAAPAEFDGLHGLDIRPAGSADAPVLLYFHGGGYITGSPRSYLPMIGYLARAAGVRTVMPRYRLAPEDPFPAAFEDAVAAWQALRGTGVAAQQILLGGDSAGGGLALALLAHLLATGERPAGILAMSPWTDVGASGPSMRENAARDAILPVERIEELSEMVAPGVDPNDPRLSPLFAAFEGAPPVYLQASKSEILRDDTLRLEKKLRAADVDVRVDLWPDTPHVWQLFRGWVPEADDALGRIAEFARSCLKAPTRPSES